MSLNNSSKRNSHDFPSKALTAELSVRLAELSDQPSGVAEVALSVLSAQKLTLLGELGIIEKLDFLDEEMKEIILTRRGRQEIRNCASLRQQP
jgi:hypothetical protein